MRLYNCISRLFACACLSSTMASAADGAGDVRILASHIGDEELKRLIADTKKLSTNGGMEENEYFYWMKYVRDHAPQRLLIWGLGFDSVLIDRLNAGGTTAFLEPNADWAAKSSNKDLNYKSYNASLAFGTTVAAWRDFLRRPHLSPLPKQFGVDCWDTILVDSPNGFKPWHPGRAVPMYTAREDVISCLKANKYRDSQIVSVFVHDNHRMGEDLLSTAILGKPVAEVGMKRLKHFVLKEPRSYKVSARGQQHYPESVDSSAHMLYVKPVMWLMTHSPLSAVIITLSILLLAYRLVKLRLTKEKIEYSEVEMSNDPEPALHGRTQRANELDD
eukprot:TRINITY_DN46444_c1_g1_i1.p1 TRINITY_DN46444_c1_g1~~TRINITY_DN46444_c1_g1_i1.p1  ORF type:complete len:332 (-),score=54.21 TRINITY_DN46444_c1_g1_i1:175-1170(-)